MTDTSRKIPCPAAPSEPEPNGRGERRELSVFEKALIIEWRRAKGWLPG